MSIILVTGCAGFIGYHTTVALLKQGHVVVGIDNLNEYYSPLIKQARLEMIHQLEFTDNFIFQKMDIADADSVRRLFRSNKFHACINLAAQAGVRYSVVDPDSYIHSNVEGFKNILSNCALHKVPLVYASTSSVYGDSESMPFREDQKLGKPTNLYAETKQQNETMAYGVSKAHGLPTTGLRFFTVYGPVGRPDMFFIKFLNAKKDGERIQVYNSGRMYRDFTYVSDIVDGIIAAMDRNKEGAKIYNLGFGESRCLLDAITLLDQGKGYSNVHYLDEMHPLDIPRTWADISLAKKELGFSPAVPLEDGVARLLSWYC